MVWPVFRSSSREGSAMQDVVLNHEQEQEAARIEDVVRGAALVEIRRACRLLASRKNREFFGQTEFILRDALHRLGARVLDAALEERKKKGVEDPAWSAPAAARTPASRDTAAAR